MNEFWALVLGSALATLGGIIGSMITTWLQKRKEKQDEKRKAYIKMLNFCHRSKLLSLEGKEFYELIAENTTIGQLYASMEVKKQYDLVNNALAELHKENSNLKDIENKIKTINALINVLDAQIKKELGLCDENSKKLLELTIEKKEEKHNGD